MPKLSRLTPAEAESLLFKSGYELIRTKGSHRIYMKMNKRIVLPFHPGRILHPKIVKQIITAIEITNQ